MAEVQKLLDGYREFYKEESADGGKLFEQLSQGQSPKTLIITCSDSRVSPVTLTKADPGEVFMIRNVANLVPPYQPDGDSLHGVSAALEFGVCHLEVKHIVVMGHSGCGGIKALREGIAPQEGEDFSFIDPWMQIAKDAKCDAQSDCEQDAIKLSLKNLESFPWIKSRIESSAVKLHGWYFRIEDGKLLTLEGDNFTDI